ncbi:MAG: hypothetical protein KFH87_11085 [Bacteroidetes bacterium]|nr:hypothetical protein [Bacteroidota bacterium]
MHIRNTSILLASVILTLAVFTKPAEAQEARGMTSIPFGVEEYFSVGEATPISPEGTARRPLMREESSSLRNDWRVIDSVVLDTWIPPLGFAGIQFDSRTRSLLPVPGLPTLRFSARQAVARAPRWLRSQLEHTLSQLSGFSQENLATVINEAVDPYIDEICFAIAHSSPSFLQSQYCYSQLFLENAELIYAHDAVLPYVEVVDYGTSTDDDYYSTVRYWRIDADSNRVQVEVPRDIYYWYIVHPKLTDEIPAYVDPSMTESRNAIKPPPQGVFWRDYVFNVTEPVPDTTGVDYPILRNLVSQCDVLWADQGDEPQAVRQITKWIRAVLDFTSGNERPHQPARIYTLHVGRCGEHEDLTAAAARACLIPTKGISAFSTDHVWNEFWDEEWCQWEPVNRSHKDPFVYSERWGWKFGSVMARRSDGKFTPVTDRYAKDVSTVEIHARDASGEPVDGAMVMLAVKKAGSQNIFIDTFGATDQDGVARFIVGAGHDYYARFDSPDAGSCPDGANQVRSLMTNAVAGRAYSYELDGTSVKQQITRNGDLTGMEDDIEDFVIEHHFDGGAQAIRWQQRFDDINSVNPSVFYSEESGGTICRGFVDAENFQRIQQQQSFSTAHGNAELPLDQPSVEEVEGLRFNDGLYHLYVNHTNVHNPLRIKTRYYLKMSPLVNIEQVPDPQEFTILGFAPHPVGSDGAMLTLRVPPPDAGRVRLELHDMLGRMQQSSVIELHGGTQTIHWMPPALPRGPYLLRLQPNGGAPVQQLLLLGTQ